MHVCVSVIKQMYSYTFLSTPGSCKMGHHKQSIIIIVLDDLLFWMTLMT